MLPFSPSFLLVLAVLQVSPVVEPPTIAGCEDMRRIELSLPPTPAERELCVSPGLLTGLLFDAPVHVELQDEVRFVEVSRGRIGISFVPPRDMVEGERLRLTARFVDGGAASREDITFTLVAHSGRATHQVEVYRDRRTRESFQQEVAQERARTQHLSEENQRLRGEVERMRAQVNQPVGLRTLITSGLLKDQGVLVRSVMGYEELQKRELSVRRISCYRSEKNVAVAVWVSNSGTEPWTVVGGSLAVNDKPLEGLVWQAETIAPGKTGLVVVEAEGPGDSPQGDATLSLWEAGPRAVNLRQVAFP